jgi:lysine-specific histone demethylase 1B
MNRHGFIKRLVLACSSFLVSSKVTAFSKRQVSSESPHSTEVIIIGAGAAGLQAGKTLSKKGIDFLILEASSTYGGRLGQLDGFADFPLDTGAQWLHGKKSLLKKSLKKSKTKVTKDKSKERFWYRNALHKKLPSDLKNIVKRNRAEPDMSYAEMLDKENLSDDYKYIIEQMAGDQGADASQLSVKWNAIEEENWNSGNKDYKFRKTYFDFINESIAVKVKSAIKLNTAVKDIDYQADKIELRDTTGKRYTADKVIVTVPITVLQDEDISFSPALPSEKRTAFRKIGMGPGMKVFLKFKEKFYHENIYGGAICAAYADETIGKKGEDNILMAFVMGNQAAYLSSLYSDKEITQALLAELDEMYSGQASKAFVDAHVIDWTKHPFIKGAYSYSKIGIGNARVIAAQSLEDKVFFAGEAMNLNGHHQTVHGAVETGLMQAKNVAELLRLKRPLFN